MATRPPPRTRSRRRSRTSSRRRSASSSCSWSAGRARWTCSTPSRTWRSGPASRCPRTTGRPKSQFTKGDEVILPSTRKLQKHGKSGIEVSDLMPHLATCVDDICFLRSCWCTSTDPRPGDVRAAHRPHADGLPEPRLVGDLRPRQREREPAGVLRDAAARGRAGRRRAVLVGRLPAGGLPGHAAAQGAEPDPEPEAAGRTSAASRTGGRSTWCNEAQRAADRGPATPSSRPASPATNWRSGCSSTPRRRSICRRKPRRRRRPTASTTRRPPTSARGCCSRGGWSSAGVRFVQVYSRRRPARHAVGRPRRHQRQPREDVRPRRPADRRAAEGPEAARAAEGHAGGLVQRVRPDAEQPGRQGPRPQPARLHDVAGRRRREGRAGRRRRPTSSA